MTSYLQRHIPESEAPHLNEQVRAGNQEVWVGQDIQPLEALWLPGEFWSSLLLGVCPLPPMMGPACPHPPHQEPKLYISQAPSLSCGYQYAWSPLCPSAQRHIYTSTRQVHKIPGSLTSKMPSLIKKQFLKGKVTSALKSMHLLVFASCKLIATSLVVSYYLCASVC